MARSHSAAQEPSRRTLTSELVAYPQAAHAFLAEYGPSYEPVAAAAGLHRMVAWIKAHGV